MRLSAFLSLGYLSGIKKKKKKRFVLHQVDKPFLGNMRTKKVLTSLRKYVQLDRYIYMICIVHIERDELCMCR